MTVHAEHTVIITILAYPLVVSGYYEHAVAVTRIIYVFVV